MSDGSEYNIYHVTLKGYKHSYRDSVESCSLDDKEEYCSLINIPYQFTEQYNKSNLSMWVLLGEFNG